MIIMIIIRRKRKIIIITYNNNNIYIIIIIIMMIIIRRRRRKIIIIITYNNNNIYILSPNWSDLRFLLGDFDRCQPPRPPGLPCKSWLPEPSGVSTNTWRRTWNASSWTMSEKSASQPYIPKISKTTAYLKCKRAKNWKLGMGRKLRCFSMFFPTIGKRDATIKKSSLLQVFTNHSTDQCHLSLGIASKAYFNNVKPVLIVVTPPQ